MITITSRRGMSVTISEETWAKYQSRFFDRAKEKLLSDAGDIYKHRQNIKAAFAQIVTPEQRQEIESRARAFARACAIEAYMIDDGYGDFVRRAKMGGMVPEGAYSQAQERAAKNIGEITLTDWDYGRAMEGMGLFSPEDLAHSRRVSDWCDWEISVPDGWGK
jgi:hypothetical protein